MEKTVPERRATISPEEWAQVPASVLCLGLFHERETRSERLRKLIEELVRRMDGIDREVAALRTENELLKEQLARTSANSSQPSSKNPQGFKPNRKNHAGGVWDRDVILTFHVKSLIYQVTRVSDDRLLSIIYTC